MHANVTYRHQPDASPHLQVVGEQVSGTTNRKIAIPKRAATQSTRIELSRPKVGQSSEPLALTYQQAADALQVSVSTIKRRVKDGDLTAVMIGSLPRILRASIQQLLGEH